VEQVREHTKKVCQIVGKDGGFPKNLARIDHHAAEILLNSFG
jgi:regulator of RNase E activity RraB